ncbi:MAG: toll/interleukin-1 receptor domain-containing protein [Phycisphaerae bacterium]|nr:toll/interleukin-1 receptor domain-containing protein [Phycisphaerae bacterium]
MRRLGEAIEQTEFAGRRLSVFLDEWDVGLGANIVLRLNEGLRKSRFVAVIMTPELVSSEWCSMEWSSVFHQDPTNRSRRLLVIRLRDFHLVTKSRIDVPPLIDTLNFLDFRDSKAYQRELARLRAHLTGQAPPRGATGSTLQARPAAAHVLPALPDRREAPDQVPETLVSNLLPVRHFPSAVWGAQTALRTHQEFPKGVDRPPCILREERIFTFADLSRSTPFDDVIGADTPRERFSTVEWGNDESKWRWMIELLNRTLGRYLRSLSIGYDPETRRSFFLPRKAGQSVFLRWGGGKRPRCLVRAPTTPNGNWVHQAARLRFETLSSQLFLSVEPCWMFTTDGRRPVPSKEAGPLAMSWGGRERNGAILRHVLMWSEVLANGKRETRIPAADQSLTLGKMPVTVRMPVSIADDHVGIAALLKLTEHEENMTVDEDDPLFEYLEAVAESDGRAEDDGDELDDFTIES